MKKICLLLMAGCMVTSVANASTIVSYSASDSPGSSPDGNGNSVDVWTVTGDGGAGRSYLKGLQDGNANMWAIWDLSDQPGGTYATHTFAGGALTVGQSVSIDYTHNTNIDNGQAIGIRMLDGANNEVSYEFIGGDLNYSKYDTGSGVFAATDKQYDNFDIYQVVFTLTGANSYDMTVSEGSITDAGYKPSEDGNPDVGSVIASWSGTFTGSSISGIQVFTEGGNDSDQWFDNLAVIPEPATIGLVGLFGVGMLFVRRRLVL